MKEKIKQVSNQSPAIYGMAFLGALVFYIQQASTFWEGVVGVVKAIFWPAMLIYKLLEVLYQ